MGSVALGFLARLAAGLVTSIGAAPILFGGTVSRRPLKANAAVLSEKNPGPGGWAWSCGC
jgi:hypothetical protein